MSEPKITPTADPRVRIAYLGPRNWRTEVRESVNGSWCVTGPAHLTRAEALLSVDGVVSRHFGEPTHDRIRSLMAQVERLTAQRDELQAKVYAEKRHNGALMVDADQRERRAAENALSCTEHGKEIQYLRHMVSWEWNSMNDSEDARMAIVSALGNTVLAIKRGAAGPDGTLKADDVAKWLEEAIAKQDKPLRRHGYPTLADCLRSAAGTCEHEGVSEDVKKEIAEALGLAVVPF
jgi:hypothetical protein